jgi:hypothetical protein
MLLLLLPLLLLLAVELPQHHESPKLQLFHCGTGSPLLSARHLLSASCAWL